MRRPLHELPLYQFLPAVPDSMHSRHNKRPLSPAGSSPAKRRNLAGQDMLSPERIFKSPPSSLRKTIASARFSDVITGPQSPARVLDFGLPKHLAGDPEKRLASEFPVDNDIESTPTQRHPSSSRLAPSPELKPHGFRTRRTENDDVFAVSSPCRPNPSSRCSYTLIPRELPPRSEPYSPHYPGFIVYQDSHVAAYDSPCEDDSEVEEDEEAWKENSRVAVTNNIATPRSSSFPKAFLDGDKYIPSSKFKPGSPRTSQTDVAGSSSATLLKRQSEAKKNSRRILLDELDFEENYSADE